MNVDFAKQQIAQLRWGLIFVCWDCFSLSSPMLHKRSNCSFYSFAFCNSCDGSARNVEGASIRKSIGNVKQGLKSSVVTCNSIGSGFWTMPSNDVE